ncbi:hypothetical protein AMOR_40240 [Anaeromyxobacter oryzae]|uniref:Uncharacterized protein n=1 Tax=Anaeromyxobacter oryzae TaxID=2918170 RepID=A0ABM7WZQ3_9BACT|nr:hypothetical protein AMOR_40240 [Anaeromyxobacter oryzae]
MISYSVLPALPAGLSLNTSTGVISGTPSAVTSTAVYTITATNSAGSTTAGVSITVNPGGGGVRTVAGTVTYDFVPAIFDPQAQSGTLAFNQASAKPVRDGTVMLLQGTDTLATATTSDTGQYSITYTPTGTGSLTLVALARTTTPAIEVRDNTDQKALWGISAPLAAANTTLNLHATHGWTGTAYDPSKRTAAPFAILDSMYTASKAVLSARPATSIPPLVVNWSPKNVPQAGDKTQGFITTSHYSPAEGQIYVLGAAAIDTDEFDNHVIVHEWGHFFESKLSRSDSPGGPHGPGDVLDPRVAFGEGYGTAISAMTLNDPIYADTLWGGPGGTLTAGGTDVENNPPDAQIPGAFSEANITGLLYDLFDGANESFDQVALGLGPIVDVLTGPERTTEALTTIASFITGLKGFSPGAVTAIDALLAHYAIGPVTTEWGEGDGPMADMYQTAVVGGGAFAYLLSYGRYNTWAENEYFVFQGNGAQVTISASSSEDVGITLYRQGTVLVRADQYGPGGTEQISGPTQAGQTYVLVLTGYADQGTGEYQVTLNVTSP